MKKKLLLCIVILLLFVGCSKKKDVGAETKKVIPTKKEEKEEVKYVSSNPIKLSLYVDKKKINEYVSSMPIYNDIVSLECYYTEDDTIIDGKFKDVFNHYYKNFQDISEYKIGYYIKFSTTDGEIAKYIYRPSDVESFFNYIQVYLYDDIHQDGGYYDHVSNEEYNDNTLLTSIKLTASMYIDRVNSDVEVTVFTYKKDDIDSNGEYIGSNKYKVLIKRQ